MTILELMVAISVLLIAISGTMFSQVSSNRLISTSAETSTAMADLQACMEQILLLAPEDIPVPGSEFEANQPVAAFEGLHLDNERIIPSYPGYTGGAVPDPLQIVLTISWQDHMGGTRTLQLPCIKTR